MKKIRFNLENTSKDKEIKYQLKVFLKEENIKTTKNNEYQILSSTKNDVYLQSEYFNNQVASGDNVGYKVLKRNRIVLSPQNAWMGNINLNNKYDIGIVSPSYKIFKIENASYDYFRFLIKTPSFIDRIDKFSEQGASVVRKNLNLNELLDSKIYIPSIREQEKIGGFFRAFDKLTQKQKEKISLLKELKKGYLQNLFPTKGAKVPKIRFKGFADAWEQCELGKLSKLVTKGTTPLDKTGEGSINFVKVENIDSFSGEISNLSKISIEEHNGYLKRSQLQENDILFSIAGTLGRITSVNKAILPANTNQALAIIRLKDGNLNFLKTALKGKAVEDYIRKNPTVGAQPNLSLEQVKSIIVDYPSADEQLKLGNYFDKLEKLITLHQRKLEVLEDSKKGYMQRLFT